MAVQYITKKERVYNVDYGWKNSLEFKMHYEQKVNNVKFDVEGTIVDEKLNDEEKTEKFQGTMYICSFIVNKKI